MKRPWQIWVIFAGCLALIAGAFGWLTWKAMALDRAEADTRLLAAHEERIRLALWRMDSAASPLVAQESARVPLSETAPDGRPSVRLGEFASSSPALLNPVLFYFRFDADGRLIVPTLSAVEGQVSQGRDAQVAVQEISEKASFLRDHIGVAALRAVLKEPDRPPHEPWTPVDSSQSVALQQPVGPQEPQQQQSLQSIVEFQARSQIVNQNTIATQKAARITRDELPAPNGPAVQSAVMTPLWHNGELLLARRVSVAGREHVEGCLLHWPTIEGELVSLVGDLLPEARLLPVESPRGGEVDHSRMLAALPVRLDPGPQAASAAAAVSSIRFSLLVAWGALLLAVLAVGVLLMGVLSLSERRAAFVSAVTHELRTPLTTFRLYAEMLADGMVQDEQQQRSYLTTLKTEADRLMHLVENVLSYARLERTRPATRVTPVSVQELLDRVTERLSRHAEQANMQLSVSAAADVRGASVCADLGAVEQILFNLVDNAGKYAATAADRTLNLEVTSSRRHVLLRVRDFGPGIPARARRRLFTAFQKSASDAAHSAPGVGLGLALSRRLARQMGGDLDLDAGVQPGAAFALRLPRDHVL